MGALLHSRTYLPCCTVRGSTYLPVVQRVALLYIPTYYTLTQLSTEGGPKRRQYSLGQSRKTQGPRRRLRLHYNNGLSDTLLVYLPPYSYELDVALRGLCRSLSNTVTV